MLMVEIATSNPNPLSWRAAWLLNDCMENNDPRIKPLLKIVIQSLNHKKDGHQRELLKIIYRMDVPEELEGVLFDKCVSIWESTKKTPSVRIMAFKVLIKTAVKYPALKNELKLLTQKHYTESLSPGIKRSLTKMISLLN